MMKMCCTYTLFRVVLITLFSSEQKQGREGNNNNIAKLALLSDFQKPKHPFRKSEKGVCTFSFSGEVNRGNYRIIVLEEILLIVMWAD